MVTPFSNVTYQKNIWMQKSTGEYYSRHYVTFVLKNLYGTRYNNVDTVVYNGDITENSGVTGFDGSIVFHLFEDIEYRVTFINSTQGISEEIIVYPRDDTYVIYITDFSFAPASSEMHDNVQWWYQKESINLSAGWLNFSYRDINNKTTYITYWINDTNSSIVYTTNTAYPCSTADVWESNNIVNASNHTYLVHFSAIHPDYPELEHSALQTISFYTGKLIDLLFEEQWQYTVTSICIIVFIGCFAGATNVATVSVIMCLTAWFFTYIRWLESSTVGYAALVLATVLAVGFAMRKAEVVHT